MSSKQRAGYTMLDGEFADVEAIDLSYGSAIAVATPVYSGVLELGDRAVARLTLSCTALTAGDSFDVTIQTSRNGYDGWYTAGTFTTVSATGSESKVFLLDRFVRAMFDGTDAGGGISYTCTVTGEAA